MARLCLTLALAATLPAALASGQAPVITGVGATESWDPGLVAVSGQDFLAPLEVSVDGLSVVVNHISTTLVTFVPPDLGPGHADVTVETPFGETTAPDGLLLYPAVTAPTVLPVGQVLHLDIEHYLSGPFFLGASANLLSSPLPLPSLAFNDLWLDPATTVAVPGWIGVYGKGSTTIDVPVPATTALAGTEVFVQGLGLAGGGMFAFTNATATEFQLPGGPDISLVEDFSSPALEDELRSGAAWGGGVLAPGLGGGAGYLGDLVVDSGLVLALSTEGSTSGDPAAVFEFSGPGVVPLGADASIPTVTPNVTVTDGVYHFSHVAVRPGGLLEFAGETPPRIFARGDLVVQGLVQLSGEEPPENPTTGHKSDTLAGGAGGAGGPGGGDGGRGADRPDASGTDLLPVGGVENPGAVIDGQDGEGVGGAGTAGAGHGGDHWPPSLPTGAAQANWNDLDISNVLTCSSDQVGMAGGGGAHSTDGGAGIADPPLLPNLPGPTIPTPSTPGGNHSLGPAEMTLDPEQGYLRGGAGGGGGGASVHLTRVNGLPLNCSSSLPPGAPMVIWAYYSHSAAGGAGAGGAGQFNAGNRAVVDGVIDASGGDGGDSFSTAIPGQFDAPRSAAPGGAGSGGAVLLQGTHVQLGATPQRLVVDGGAGGDGVGDSVGGDGGTGVVRLEGSGLQALAEAPKVSPFDPGDPLSPTHLSVGDLQPTEVGPAALSGAQSCWLTPGSAHLVFDFADDDPIAGTVGWDMTLATTIPGNPLISYRVDEGLLGESFESFHGNDLLGANGAPLAVRFQGVRTTDIPADPCDLTLEGETAGIVEGSLTGWVRHPRDLDTWWDHLGAAEKAKRQPNAVRWMIVFDASTSAVPEMITGVVEIEIAATLE